MNNAEQTSPAGRPMVVAIEMGYGHMRAGAALADALEVDLLACDRPPLADAQDQKRWRRWRRFYEWLTRTSATRMGAPLRPLVRSMTDIAPLESNGDLTRATWPVRRLERFIRKKGLGDRLVEALRAERRPLLATYFAPAIAADMGGADAVYLVVTDSDIHRIWAPKHAASTRIRYLVPSDRARARLVAYGVPNETIEVTGFPLPGELIGDAGAPILRANLATRLARLDPQRRFTDPHADVIEAELGPVPVADPGAPLTITFAVGGAGTQADMVARFLPGLQEDLVAGRLHLALVAGIRPEVEVRFRRALAQTGLEAYVEILRRDTHREYFEAFNELLARTDVLWTKPSEMSFFAALGLPLLLAPPVGEHEAQNRAWLVANGAALDLPDIRAAGAFLDGRRSDGSLAEAAWSGFRKLPFDGLHRILARLEADVGHPRSGAE